MSPPMRRTGPPRVDGAAQHRDWMSLVEIEGPFLTAPVLNRVWPTLEAVSSETMGQLREVHEYAARKPRAWVEYVVAELLGWEDPATWAPTGWDWTPPERDAEVACHFALLSDSPAERPHPHVLGYLVDAGSDPRGRIGTDDWAATPVDRAALACRALDVPFALVTSGRLWCLVWAPRGGVTGTVTFDTATWSESADRVVVRAFVSLLGRARFVGAPEGEGLDALLRESLDAQEEITETLGVQVRLAVEQLVEAMGRWDASEAGVGRPGLSEIRPPEVYRGSVRMLMRLVFLLFAEERGLLPADNPVYAQGYGVSTLCERLEVDAQEAGEEALHYRSGAWLQLLAISAAVYRGVRTARLNLPAYDGSLFDPAIHPWLARVAVDDRTLLHVLRSVQYVVIKSERRKVSFRTLEVEQIGYVYEGLLAFDATRAEQWTLGLIGKSGAEAEVPLPELEALLGSRTDYETGVVDRAALAADLAERYRPSGIGSLKKLTGLLAPIEAKERTRRLQRLLAVTEGDQSLAERILPLFALLRHDLRGLPTVIPAGSLYATASSARAQSGTHYTPSELAREITETALLPLVYRTPGPLDTTEETAWVPASADDILQLKVADIAMGSGAFLVAACRFLADRLIAAWAQGGEREALDHLERTGAEGAVLQIDGAVPEIVTRARRLIVQHCLYGVDINPMAVEMAKLSLWLVSMDPQRPFTFLDDRLTAGDSLLGLASLEQLEALHLDVAAGREIHGRWVIDPTAGVRTLLADLAAERQRVADLPGESLDQLDTKREALAGVERMRWRVDLLADLVVSTSLAHAGGGQRALRNASKHLEAEAGELVGQPEISSVVAKARERVQDWLETDHAEDADPRDPFHWPLRFPEVFNGERGGFDAIVGNPPFLGGKKITGAMGTAYRNYLLHGIGRSVRGNADLVAYFVLRAHELLNPRGQAGLIATNTLAQGDTREVGLDQLAADGVTIKAAIKSEPWPSRSAVLEYSAAWTSRRRVRVPRLLDRVAVNIITPALDAGTRASGIATRLAANGGIAFIGSYVLGMGFTMEPDRARTLIEADPRNAEVLFPYLNGQDLNSRPDSLASRWVINFHDWTEDRAASYPIPFQQVSTDVKPERQRRKPSGEFVLRRPLPERYWHYADKRPALVDSLGDFDRAIAITLVSNVVMPIMVRTGQVFAHKLAVVASEDTGLLATLSSNVHYWWVVSKSSTLGAAPNYSPTDVFETFARPDLTDELRGLGDKLDRERRDLMLARWAGLTATYNLVHDPACTDDDIVGLRELHRDIDVATFDAYGWADLVPVHDHHETRRGVRWTIDPATRTEMLDRLLELNQERYAQVQGSVARDDAEDTLFS